MVIEVADVLFCVFIYLFCAYSSGDFLQTLNSVSLSNTPGCNFQLTPKVLMIWFR